MGELVRTCALDHGKRRAQQNLDVHPRGPGPCVSQVKANHLVKCHTTASADLPESRDSWFCFEHPPAVPEVVGFEFVWNWRTRTHP